MNKNTNEHNIREKLYTSFKNPNKRGHNVSSSVYNNHINLFDKKYDEPTYISIRVDFFPDRDDVKNSSINTYNYDYMPCPLLLGNIDELEYETTGYFDKKSEYEKLGSEQQEIYRQMGPSQEANGLSYSTEKYLKDNIGDVRRARLLHDFKNGLMDLMISFPYYIKSVTGLTEILKIDPKRGSRVNNNGVLTITCYEGLDMKINSLLNMYKKIAWDDVYQRWILPDMMRYFRMDLYISEFRTFHSSTAKSDTYNFKENPLKGPSKAKTLLGGISITNTIKNIASQIGSVIGSPRTTLEKAWSLAFSEVNNQMPTLKFECDMCEFDISDLFSHFNEISVSDPAKTPLDDIKIKIKIGNIKEYHNFSLLNDNSKHIILPDSALSVNPQIEVKTPDRYEDYNNISYANRTGVKFIGNDHLNTTFISDATSVGGGDDIISKTLKNTINTAIAWADNYANDKVNQFMNKTHGSGISIKGAMDAITSADLFTMYNTFKTKADAMKSLYPEVSQATVNGLDVEVFEGMLNGIATSTAATDNEKAFRNIAEQLLQYGKSVDIRTTDMYLNIIKDAIQLSETSKATSEKQMNRKVIL